MDPATTALLIAFTDRRLVARTSRALGGVPVALSPVASTRVAGRPVTIFAVTVGASREAHYRAIADRVSPPFATVDAALRAVAA